MEKISTRYEIEKLLDRLKIQRRRFLTAIGKQKREYQGSNNYIHHDLDYYLILARRLYRFVEDLAGQDSKIANIKGKKDYRGLHEKIKMRDDSEHPPKDLTKFPSIVPGSQIKAIHNVVVTGNKVVVISRDQTWDMKENHTQLVNMMREVVTRLNELHFLEMEAKLKKH